VYEKEYAFTALNRKCIQLANSTVTTSGNVCKRLTVQRMYYT